MPVYSAPTRDMKFLLHEVLGFEDLTKYDAFSEVDADLDFNNEVNVFDLLGFLEFWFQGC